MSLAEIVAWIVIAIGLAGTLAFAWAACAVARRADGETEPETGDRRRNP